jgi:molybdate transport system ATP-binding protein
MELRIAVSKQFGPFRLQMDHELCGDRIGVFGPSGSGKSTLAGLIAGLQEPDAGFIRLDGETLYSREERINVPPERRRVGIVFQHSLLFPHLDVRANLLYGHRRSAIEDRRITLDSVATALGIGHLLGRGVNHLSGGEKQRVALGRAVLANPRLLLMDEPLSALDDRLRFQIIPYLSSVCERFDIPCLFISHALTEMRLMTDQVVVLEKGRVVAQTSAEEFARQRMGESRAGYINLLRLGTPRAADGLFAYPWGDGELIVSAGNGRSDTVFELSSKDIILFKKHPEAISARNLLACRVSATFRSGNRTGVELECGNDRLVAEVVTPAATELEIGPGSVVYAAIKASAFRERGG